MMMGMIGFNSVVAGGATVSITNTASPVDTTGQTTYIFTGVAVGTSGLVVVVDASRSGSTVSNATGCTIGGLAATLVQAGINTASGTLTCNIWQLAAPGGATTTITVTYPSAMLRCGIAVYSVTGSNGVAPSGAAVATTNYAAGNSVAMTVTVPSGGGSIIGSANIVSASVTPTNYSEVQGVDKIIGGTTFYETGTDTSHSGSTAYTADWGGNPSNGLGTAAAWSP